MVAAGKLFLFAIVALSVTATPLWAYSPVEESSYWEIPRLGAPSQIQWDTYRLRDAKSPSLASFGAEYGGNWRYQVNRATGTYHHVYGSGIDLGVSLRSPEEVEALARLFMGDNQGLFSIRNENLEVMNNAGGLGKKSIIFQQTHEGLEVWGGRCHLVFTDSGRLFALGSDVYPDVAISTTPSLSESDALAIATGDIGFQHGLDEVGYSDFLILPVEMSESGFDYRLAYRFDLKVEDPYGIWMTWVDAHTGEILWRENLVRFDDYTGHVQGDVEWDGICDGTTADYPMINQRIDITGVGTTYTDANGDFFTSGGSGSQTISAEFLGYWVDVDRFGGGDPVHSGTITGGVPYTIDWDNTNSAADERDVFSYVNRQHDWLKAMDPAFTVMDYQMTATVKRTDLYCPGNAWWDGSGINFCSSSGSYANTGRLGDVVYHEYGHGITDFMYGIQDPPSDMHEGNSDIVANLLTRESIMGLGFYTGNCTSGIRDSDNTMQYPCTGEGHYCGQLIAGFHWDAWEELLAAYPQAYADSVVSNTWHFGRKMGLPQNQPDQVYWTFVADDDDGDLDNGTPHHTQFCTAAQNHNFTCPEIVAGVIITHTPLDDTPNTLTPYPVTVVITSTEGAIDVGSLRVTFRADGGSFVDSSMTATGGTDEYVGNIAPQPACSQVEYYIYAEDVLANSGTDPRDAPTTLHSFLVGYDVVFEDDFETDKGWTAGVAGDDATTGQWERCDPEWTEAQAEDDNTPAPGVNAYITQCAAGTGQGSYDIDGGKTTLLSPMLNLSTYSDATVSYYRWYSNDTGAEPGTDYWVVEVTDDDWTTWATLENTNVSDRRWTMMEFDVTGYVDLTNQVQFRFIASDYDPGSLVEAGVDDFLLVACSSAPDTEPPTVTVLDPNGGEEAVGGSSTPYQIQWTSGDNVGVTTTHILLSTDGGSTYPDTVASGALSSPWDWYVPDMDETACRIKVVCLDAALNEGSDESDADFEIISVTAVEESRDVPVELVLRQNRPNPFNPVTEIEFGLPAEKRISLEIFNVQGRLVSTLAEGIYASGYHTVVWRGTDTEGVEVSTGVYFYRLMADDKVFSRKMLMLK